MIIHNSLKSCYFRLRWARMCFISVPNVKEINPQEGCFLSDALIIGQILEIGLSATFLQHW